jgi:protein-S-isoprenylcysteine O-methyltransferase Ste14
VSAVGFTLRCLTVGFTPNGTSGRSTTAPSAVTLNTAGMYSIVRNPLYLANGIMWLGVALSTASGWFTAVTVLTYWLYIERVISAEEVFLDEQFGERYRAWVAQTPCFLPRLSQWLPPDRPFSLRAVVRREYHCVVAVASAFTFVELVSDVFLEGEPFQSWLVTDRGWVVFFCSALAFGAVIRTAKKQHWLDDVDTKKGMPTSP